MHRSFLFLLLLLYGLGAFSQNSSAGKLSASLKSCLADEIKEERFIIRKGSEVYVPVLMQLTGTTAVPELTKAGIRFRTIAGEVATADIPLQAILSISDLPSVVRMELPLLFRKTDTTMLRMTKANKVLNGETPLAKAYTGNNTVIGIIDDGIDITHTDFLDSSGKTRVSALWNMDGAGQPPVGYAYGRLLLPDSLNYFINKFRTPTTTTQDAYALQRICGYAYHGSSVTGLAAGNSGVAPHADIVAAALTAFGDTLLRSDRVIDAIAFIYSVAAAKEKKCIINISLGLIDGAPHDGKSLVEKAIDAFCSNKPNLLVCVSAGNNGNTWKHWGGFPIRSDSSFGVFTCAYKASMYFTIPKAYSSTLRISLTESKKGNPVNITRDSIYYQTPFVTISNLIQSNTPITFYSNLKNGQLSSDITFTAAHYNNEYDELIVTTYEHTSGALGAPVFDEHLYRFVFKREGYVHGWYPFLNLHPIFFSNYLQYPYPADSTFHVSDNDYTTNIPSHAFTVLSSGTYNIRNCYVDSFGKLRTTYPSCQLTYFTSHGPTLDGRIKPDLLAPGEDVLAPRSRTQTFFGYGDEASKDWYYFGGTSASSPITAGIAALLWQRFPEYTRDYIIARLKATTYTDTYTAGNGAIPNNLTGWGKIDAFKALTGVSTNDPTLCNPVICMGTAPTPQVPISPATAYTVKVLPNPASNYLFIYYTAPAPVTLYLYNVLGQKVRTLPLLPSINSLQMKMLDLTHLSAGIYFLKVGNDTYSFSDKILVIH